MSPHQQQLDRTPEKKTIALLPLALVIGIVLALGLAFVSLPVSKPVSGFCAKTCHTMNPAYQSWRRSSHGSIACLDCHSDGSGTDRFVQLVKFGAGHIRREIKGAKGREKIAGKTPVPDGACRRCHQPKKRSKSKGAIMDHEVHAVIGVSCLMCHNRVAHRGAEGYTPVSATASDDAFPDFMSMKQGCWRCHSKEGVFVDLKGRRHKGPYRKGGVTAPTDCDSCHAGYALARFKKDLKKIEARHENEGWGRGTDHGPVARGVEFKLCQVCHNPAKRCAVCHRGVAMPHPNEWAAAHGRVAKAGGTEACRLCHGAVKAVPTCTGNGHHHEEFVEKYEYDLDEAPWVSGEQRHGRVARVDSAQPCRRCHEQSTECAKCHGGVVMPHGSEWRKTHFTAVGYTPGDGWKPRPTACDQCHNRDGKDGRFCVRCHHQDLVPADKAQNQAWAASPMTLAREVYGVGKRLATGIGPCADCHAFQFCRRCHESFSE